MPARISGYASATPMPFFYSLFASDPISFTYPKSFCIPDPGDRFAN